MTSHTGNLLDIILALVPEGEDGLRIVESVREAGWCVETCATMDDLTRQLSHSGDTVDVVLLADEAGTTSAELSDFTAWLHHQEPWSDLPMILLTTADRSANAATQDLLETLEPFGVVTVLERPTHPRTTITALQVAVRARHRQYQVRDLLKKDREYAAVLELAKAESEAANRAKDQFLAVLSHELRTPLNAILGWTQLMRIDADDRETRLTALDVIERNTRAQVQLIEDLLDVSRITNGKLKLDVRPVDPCEIVQAVLDTVRPTADVRGVLLRHFPDTGPVLISADPDRLQQIVWNLFTNAIKFTPRGGRVDIYSTRAEVCFELVVADTGLGIAPEFLSAIFDRFTQQDPASTRAHKGLGLGLSICRHLVEQHGGVIFVESPGLGQGATFTLRLPLLAPSPVVDGVAVSPAMTDARESSDPPIPPPQRELDGIRVLVVDDDSDARVLLQHLLTRRGAEVLLAASAREAFQTVERMAPDVMLCDIEMPEENGYSLIKRVRALGPGGGGALPAAALTAYAREEDRLRALAAGFQHHVTKPLDPSGIIALVASMAGRTAVLPPM